jgi:hypothetical protein
MIIKINIINNHIKGINATLIINTLKKEKIEYYYSKSDFNLWKSLYFDIKRDNVIFKIRISNHPAKPGTIFREEDTLNKILKIDEIVDKIISLKSFKVNYKSSIKKSIARIVDLLEKLEDNFPKFTFRIWNDNLIIKHKEKVKFVKNIHVVTYNEVKDFCDNI